MTLELGRIRKVRRISQKKMAEELGVKIRTYGSWEREEVVMNITQLVECARILDCSCDEILGLEVPTEFSDPREAELHRVWLGLDWERQDRLIGIAHDMETAMETSVRGSPQETASA